MGNTLKERLELAMKGPPLIRQIDLARACGVKPPSVADWLNGRTKRLEGNNLLRAARALNVSPEWLGSGRGPMRMNESAPEKTSQSAPGAPSHFGRPDPTTLHEAVTLLLFDLDHGGPRSARSATSLLLDLYDRIAAAGGQLPEAEQEAFEEQARSRGMQGVLKHERPGKRTGHGSR